MSAFSDWNGPGGCGNGGASLPQIQTLEQLIARIGEVETEIGNVLTALNGHINTSGDTPHGIGATAQAKATTAAAAVSAIVGSGFTAASTVRTQLDAVIARAQTLEQVLSGYSGAGAVQTAIAAVNAKLGGSFSASSTIASALTDLTTVVNAKATPAQITAAVDALKNTLVDSSGKLKLALNTVEDINVGRVNLRELADFKKWFVRSMPLRAITNRQYGNVVAIVGYLSKDYFDDQASKPSGANSHKSAIAFLKYADDKPWDALVQMAATPDSTALDSGYRGGISVLSAKTGTRTPYPAIPAAGIDQLPPLRFGLFKGTSISGGDERIYLGVVIAETYGITYDVGSWVHNSGPIEIFVAGINFMPIDNGSMPNGGVEEICHADAYENGSFSTENISAEEIRADSYLDAEGNVIWKEATGPDGDYLQLGNLEVHLELQSKDRPTVEHADHSKHDIAYLSDLSNSIYWQQTVTVIADNLSDLNSLKVTVSDDNPTEVITWEDTPATGHSNVPGVYTSIKTGPAPTGLVFANGAVALIKDSGQTQQEADGKLNDVLTAAVTYDKSKLINIEPDAVKAGTVPNPTANGTTFIDNEGNYGYITQWNPDPSILTFQAAPIAASQLFNYTKPAYANYDLTTKTWTLGDIIDVPDTFDGYIHDITYEWAGKHLQASGFFIESYIMWTAHHENHTSMNYTLDAWAYIDIQMEGYRTSDRQDDIDRELTLLGSAQADYAEDIEHIPFQLPEQALPETIANPAYIHHKPWTGVAVLESGTFMSPLYYHDWMVDGGDFTGMASAVDPGVTPWVPSNKQFRNAIIRIWHGAANEMPELGKAPTDPSWANFQFTLRWTDDTHSLWFSDGVKLYQLSIPQPPTSDGTYTLQCVVTGGVPAYSWV
jgi:hypothetical protein